MKSITRQSICRVHIEKLRVPTSRYHYKCYVRTSLARTKVDYGLTASSLATHIYQRRQ